MNAKRTDLREKALELLGYPKDQYVPGIAAKDYPKLLALEKALQEARDEGERKAQAYRAVAIRVADIAYDGSTLISPAEVDAEAERLLKEKK